MARPAHHIPLVAAFELRPPQASARFAFERDDSERLGACLADDLAELLPEATRGHLVTGPALMEPAQLLHPDRSPWAAMSNVAGLGAEPRPGVTAIGMHRGRAASPSLAPYRDPPQGLFLALPLLLAVPADEAEAIDGRLENELFDRGGLRPPAMGTLAGITALDPVHGQLMTRTDLMALLKVQLAGAGLDPFWPPVEHALLDPGTATRLELPAGLVADWDPVGRCWSLAFTPFHRSGHEADDYALWLRSFRQTAAMLEAHLIDWRVRTESGERDERGRWAAWPLGDEPQARRVREVRHDPVGLVGYSAVIDGRRRAYYPLDSGSVQALADRLRELGGAGFAVSDDLDWLRPARCDDSAQ